MNTAVMKPAVLLLACALTGCPDFEADKYDYQCDPNANQCVDGYLCLYDDGYQQFICQPESKAPSKDVISDTKAPEDVSVDVPDEETSADVPEEDSDDPDDVQGDTKETKEEDAAADTKEAWTGCVDIETAVSTLTFDNKPASFMLKANGIVANDAGALFFTSNKNVIFAYKAGKLIDLAGSGKSFPFSEGVGAAATFYDPLGLAYYSGQLVVADTLDHLIRRIESLEGSGKWKVSTLAGILGKTGSVDGDGADAKFYNPTGIAINSNGDIYVSDRYNHRIRKVNLISEFPLKVEVSTIAGKGVVVTAPPEGKVPMLEYPFGGPFGIAVLDDPDKLVVSNAITHHLTQIDLAKGTASVLAGANSDGFVDKVKASAARFSDPHGIASTHTGVIYVADTGNNRIRRVCYVTSDNYWYVDTVAGTGVQGRSDGGGDSATFTMPQDVAVGPNGSIYVVDNPKIAIGHSNIRKIEINPL